MKLTRRRFVSGLLADSSLPWLGSCQPNNQAGSEAISGTIAVLFDGLYSPFWVSGHDVMVANLKKRGFDIAEAISGQDDAKQLTQVRAMIARGVQGIIALPARTHQAPP